MADILHTPAPDILRAGMHVAPTSAQLRESIMSIGEADVTPEDLAVLGLASDLLVTLEREELIQPYMPNLNYDDLDDL